MYGSDSSLSDGEEPSRKIARIRQVASSAVCLTLDDTEEELEVTSIPGEKNMDLEVMVSDSLTTASADGERVPELFGGEGFHPDHHDQLEGSEQCDNVCVSPVPHPSSPPVHSASSLPRTTPYALSMCDVCPEMRAFLRSVKTYFTQRVNLERQRAPLCPSTYNKAQERMLCKYAEVRKITRYSYF